jgi:hypothetical protein
MGENGISSWVKENELLQPQDLNRAQAVTS